MTLKLPIESWEDSLREHPLAQRTPDGRAGRAEYTKRPPQTSTNRWIPLLFDRKSLKTKFLW